MPGGHASPLTPARPELTLIKQREVTRRIGQNTKHLRGAPEKGRVGALQENRDPLGDGATDHARSDTREATPHSHPLAVRGVEPWESGHVIGVPQRRPRRP